MTVWRESGQLRPSGLMHLKRTNTQRRNLWTFWKDQKDKQLIILLKLLIHLACSRHPLLKVFLFLDKWCSLLHNLHIACHTKQEGTNISTVSSPKSSLSFILKQLTFCQRNKTERNEHHQHTRCIPFQQSCWEHWAHRVLLHPSPF